MTRRIECINFNDKRDPVLLAKANAVAPYLHRKVHDAVRFLLIQALDDEISKYGINVDSKPAQSAGAD
jgi:hypothetical protein